MSVYHDSVFINCPFDDEYKPLFMAIVFSVYCCGFTPRCSLEEDDASDSRINKIIRIVRGCRYGIHDISRNQLDAATNLPRFNMPFELGIFWGAKQFGNNAQKRKMALVLEKDKYQYQKYISDINGVDIKAHYNNEETVIIYVRNWLNTAAKRKKLPGGKMIKRNFERFTNTYLKVITNVHHFSEADITFNDYCTFIEEWLEAKYPNGLS